LPTEHHFLFCEEKLVNISSKLYVIAAVLATASVAYAQTQEDPATTPRDTTTAPAATTPSTTPATPAATSPSTSGDTSAAERMQDGDMADDGTSLAPRSDRN
jgi:hypothetical protein